MPFKIKYCKTLTKKSMTVTTQHPYKKLLVNKP